MRKEIEISERTVIKLQRLADKESRSLKSYMEITLIHHAEASDTSGKQVSLLENIKLVKRKKSKK